MVSAHERSINSEDKCTSGATTDEEIEKLAKSVWSKLQKRLVNHQAIYQFFSHLITESAIPTEKYDDGILLLDPVHEPEPSVPTTTQVIEAL